MKKYCMICGRQTLAPVAEFSAPVAPATSAFTSPYCPKCGSEFACNCEELVAPLVAPEPTPFPTKKDCHMLDAIMKAAKQIRAEFDCLSDHVMSKKQIEEQLAAIIWKHVDARVKL